MIVNEAPAQTGPETCSILHEPRKFLPRTCGTVLAVLGQAHTPRRRLLPLAALAVVLAVPAVGIANPSHSAATLQSRNAVIEAKKREAILGLYSLDQKLAVAQSQLASLQHRATGLRAERVSLRRQVLVARRGSRLSEAQLAQRLRLLYEQGNVEPLEIVFGAKSLDEAMSSIDNLSRVSVQAEDVLKELKAARVQLSAASRKLASRETALAAATRQARATAASLAGARAARASYISSLSAQRRMNDREIAQLVAASRAAEVRSQQLARTSVADKSTYAAATPVALRLSAAGPATPAAGHTITVSATGYALPGRTATGLPVGWGVVAVDPSVIPLGTHMNVPGYGSAVAADTGSAVRGAVIDLWFPSEAQALAWGRRSVSITLQ